MMPAFAKCANPHLFWISLLEKAFAKLHGRYFAMNYGSTDEALADLLGVPIENCFIGSSETMTNKATFYNAMKAMCYNHCVIGAKIDHELLLSANQIDKERKYAAASNKGLLPQHIYSILDVRSVVIRDPDSKR